MFLHYSCFLIQGHENKIKMYIFKTCGAICENFVQAHFLKASFHHHLRELARSNQYFLKLAVQGFHLSG